VHDRGWVLADLACASADGAEVISDFRVMSDEAELFGLVTSVPTCWRAVSEIAARGRAGQVVSGLGGERSAPPGMGGYRGLALGDAPESRPRTSPVAGDRDPAGRQRGAGTLKETRSRIPQVLADPPSARLL
jgi:hypothetical protein